MPPLIANLVLPALAVLLIFASIVNQRITGGRRLREWAEREGCRILDAKYQCFGRGPLRWRTAAKKVLFSVRVLTATGVVKQGWVLVGSAVFGPCSRMIEVRWVEETHNQNLHVIPNRANAVRET